MKLVEKSLAEAASGAASTMLARQQRNGRRYDVPQIGEFFSFFLNIGELTQTFTGPTEKVSRMAKSLPKK